MLTYTQIFERKGALFPCCPPTPARAPAPRQNQQTGGTRLSAMAPLPRAVPSSPLNQCTSGIIHSLVSCSYVNLHRCDLLTLHHSRKASATGGETRVASLKSEYEAIQKKTFTKWTNSHLPDTVVFAIAVDHSQRRVDESGRSVHRLARWQEAYALAGGPVWRTAGEQSRPGLQS